MIGIFKKLAGLASFVLGIASVPSMAADTLSIWVMDNGLGSKMAMHRLVKKFYRETGIPVQLTSLTWNEAFDRISRAFADSNDRAPDVLQLGSTWVPHFASTGLVRPVDFLMTEIDSSRFLGEGLRSAHIAGRPEIYAVPWFIDVRGFFVNERLWQELGFEDSDVETYSQFLGVLKTIARADLKNSEGAKVTPFTLPGKDDWAGQQCLAPFVWSHGGDFVVPSGKGYRSALLDSNTLVGLALYASILGDGQMAPFSLIENSAENANGFIHSERVFHYGTTELIKLLDYSEKEGGLANSPIANDGLKIVDLISGPSGKFSFMGGSHLALGVKQDSSKYALAERLLVYMLRADNIDAFSRLVGFLPADRSILHIWNRDARYSKLVAALDHYRSFPNIPEWGEVEKVLISMSNGMGSIFAESRNKKRNSAMLAKLVYDANAKIDSILGHTASLNEAETLHRAQHIFLSNYKEVYPKNSTDFVSREELSLVDEFAFKNISLKILGAAVAGVLVVCVIVVVSFRKRKKN